LFCPESPVTRAELAVFVMRLLGIAAPSPPTNPIYSDLTGYEWARNAAEEATVLKIMSPCSMVVNEQGGAQFCPGEPATRREVAQVIARVYGY
jgi:hypothetical protein